jgi:hypothetical protein
VIAARYSGWERFARVMIAKKLRAATATVNSGHGTPIDKAGSDIWSALDAYEIFPPKFIEWLNGL